MMESLGWPAEAHSIDCGFFLMFPKRALLMSLEGYDEKEVPLHFVLFCARSPGRILGCLYQIQLVGEKEECDS